MKESSVVLTGEEYVPYMEYWRERVSILKHPFKLQNGRSGVKKAKHMQTMEFTPDEVQQKIISNLTKDSDLEVFIISLTACYILFAKYSGLNGIVIDTPLLNNGEIDEIYASTISLIEDVNQENSIKDLIIKIDKTVSGSYQFQNYPLNLVLDNDKGRKNILQTNVFISFDKIHRLNEHLDGYDLIISIERIAESETLKFKLGYDSSVFSDHFMRQFVGHYKNVLTTFKDVDMPIKSLSILSEDERRQIVEEFNNMMTEYPGDKSIINLFEEQVEKRPNTTALVFEDEVLTYAELNARANRLCGYLKKQGVKSDSIVGIMEERSLELIVSILGVLKTGAAYLPIDLETPVDRIVTMLDDSGVAILLTREGIIKDIPFTLLQSLYDVNKELVITDHRAQIKDLDALPYPDRSLIDYNKYHNYLGDGCLSKIISLVATRGCPYHCLYCHKIWPRTHVFRSAQNIYDEIKYHYDRGYRSFSFVDDIFNLKRENSEAFFKLIIKNKLNVRIQFPSGLRSDLLTPDYIDLMVEAGVVNFALALETASPRLQKLLCKNVVLEKLKENANYICKTHPTLVLDLFSMFGFPTETEEEALSTLDFIKSLKWIHFPYIFALKIWPNTDLSRLALESGITQESIEKSVHLAYHELSYTMPFTRKFTREFQPKFMNEYFLLPERLNQVIPAQKKVLTRKEITTKYNLYLPGGLDSYPDIKALIEKDGFFEGDDFVEPDKTNARSFSVNVTSCNESKSEDGLRILLLDLSQYFSRDAYQINEMVQAPLGLTYLLTYLNRELGDKVNGKIMKAMIDFDNYEELRAVIDDFKPQVIGVRALALYKNFFHKTISLIKGWCPDASIITGGPYSTSEYFKLLSDRNINAIVLGEGELTFTELIGKIIQNGGKLPCEDELRKINGLAFLPKECVDKSRKVVLLDNAVDDISKESSDNPEQTGRSNSLAYVMYTSGSTGNPKGVMAEHKNVVRLVRNSNYTDIKPDDRILQLSDYAFDGSTFDIFGSLLNGASLYLIEKDMLFMLEELIADIAANKINITFVTTALINKLIDINPEVVSCFDKIYFGGQDASLKHIRTAIKHRKNRDSIVHVYGPTEGTTFSTYYVIDEIGDDDTVIPIGAPVSNSPVYILDQYYNPVPIGIEGEIYVGGDGVAQGYLNNEELTKKSFIESPFKSGERLYKTGDIGKWRAGGNIEFVGRRDNQVKVRGFRVELAEIENNLLKHANIKQAFVTANMMDDGNKELDAYIVCSEKLNISEIRDFLGHSLPDYMIPAHFAQLDALPLNPITGKVDKNRLPKAAGSNIETGAVYEAPRNEKEKLLASIWQEVLGRSNIGVNDNYFVLGGDSIKAIQVIAKLKRDGWQLEVRDMFEHLTIADIAPNLRKKKVLSDQSIVIGEAPLTAVQRYFFNTYEGDLHHFNQSVLLQTKERVDEKVLHAVVTKIQEHHDALRITFKRDNGTVKQLNEGAGKPVDFVVLDLRDNMNGLSVLNESVEKMQTCFDLEKGPLMKAVLYRLDDADRLLIIIHHLVVDGVSWRILLEDLETGYKQAVSGNEIDLGPKTHSFKTWAEEVVRYSESDTLLEEAEYWAEIGEKKTPALPCASENGKNLFGDCGKVTRNLSVEETERLLSGIHHAYNTEMNDILLTACGRALKLRYGIDSALIAMEGHGREVIREGVDVGRTVGWFTAIFPFCLEVIDSEVGEQIKHIKESLRKAPKKGIGYGILSEVTSKDFGKDVKLPAWPQISFNYLGQFDSTDNGALFGFAKESVGQNISPSLNRQNDLDIGGIVVAEKLSLSVTYNPKRQSKEEVDALLESFKDELLSIVEHCTSIKEGEKTLADFSYPGISDDDYESILEKL